jgi:glycosyltransferase involved in cell wall biosynthesis
MVDAGRRRPHSNTMKILFVSNNIPPMAGGAENVAWSLARTLSTRHDVGVLHIDDGKDRADIVGKITLLTLPRERHALRAYGVFRRNEVLNRVRRFSPDIIQYHMPSFLSFALEKEKTPKVLTIHQSKDHEYKTSLKERSFSIYIRRRSERNVHAVIVTSRWAHAYFSERDRIAPARIIPNGVYCDTFKVLAPPSACGRTALYVGRLEVRKGVREILAAAAELPDVDFLFPSSGSLSGEIKGRNVKNIGFVRDENELCRLYNTARVCLFPSYGENFPLVGLEALACGRPVICTRRGFDEYVEDGTTGLFLESPSKDGIVEKLRGVIDDPGRLDRMSRACREKALEYDWSAIATQYENLYETLLAGKDPAHSGPRSRPSAQA